MRTFTLVLVVFLAGCLPNQVPITQSEGNVTMIDGLTKHISQKCGKIGTGIERD